MESGKDIIRTDEVELDIREILMLLRSRILLILLVGLVFAAGAAAYCFYIATPVYQSTAKLYMVSDNSSTALLQRLQEGTVIIEDYNALITSRPVVNQVDKNLNLDRGYGLASSISVTNPEDTRILTISANDTNPKLAKEIAEEFATVSMEQISRTMRVEEPTLLEHATMPTAPIKPAKRSMIMRAFLLGIFLIMLIIVIKYFLDDSIKTKSDVEKYLNVPVLASLPSDKSIAKSGRNRYGYGYGEYRGKKPKKNSGKGGN